MRARQLGSGAAIVALVIIAALSLRESVVSAEFTEPGTIVHHQMERDFW